MNEPHVTLGDIGVLATLADGIIPADERDAGASLVHAGPSIAERMRRSPYAYVYVEGLRAAGIFARERFGQEVRELNSGQVQELLTVLRDQSPAFFRQLRADVCALYLSDAGVWQRIGFPGPSRRAAATRTSISPRFRQNDENASRLIACHACIPRQAREDAHRWPVA